MNPVPDFLFILSVTNFTYRINLLPLVNKALFQILAFILIKKQNNNPKLKQNSCVDLVILLVY